MISATSRSDMEFSRRARLKLTSQRMANVVPRCGFTSTGT